MTLDEFRTSAVVEDLPGWKGFKVNGQFIMGDDRDKAVRAIHFSQVERRGLCTQEAVLPREITSAYPELDARNALQIWRNLIKEKEGVLTAEELEALKKDLDWALEIKDSIPSYNDGLRELKFQIEWRRNDLNDFYYKKIAGK